ncbi:hypothetical protein DFH08DRAFT_899794 [Mycena albidolilacea]|uniref:Uncharacterized protein n=1 Tax=Mycena albidolilacea TaxID=1033008 RepID=A0AAD6Z6X4_9AGAR|nr:hypothetical protein DFH08DRAFT_899794 [Mycena albidolilacea]
MSISTCSEAHHYRARCAPLRRLSPSCARAALLSGDGCTPWLSAVSQHHRARASLDLQAALRALRVGQCRRSPEDATPHRLFHNQASNVAQSASQPPPPSKTPSPRGLSPAPASARTHRQNEQGIYPRIHPTENQTSRPRNHHPHVPSSTG